MAVSRRQEWRFHLVRTQRGYQFPVFLYTFMILVETLFCMLSQIQTESVSKKKSASEITKTSLVRKGLPPSSARFTAAIICTTVNV